jgi:exonuclease III
VHFSAKSRQESVKAGKTIYKNKEDQLLWLNKFIAKMRSYQFQIVLAGDFNQRLTSESFTDSVLVLPAEAVPTTFKERSALQVQWKKIELLDQGSKDCICLFGFKEDDVLDCRVRSLYKNGKAACSYALKSDAATADTTLSYPTRLRYPNYELHFPDHDVVEVTLTRF